MHKGLICIDFAFRQKESFFVWLGKKSRMQSIFFFLKNQANGTKRSMAALPWLSRRKISKLFLCTILVLRIFHLNPSHRSSNFFLMCFAITLWETTPNLNNLVCAVYKEGFLSRPIELRCHWECKSIDKCSFSSALFSSFDLTNTISRGVWKILFCLFGSLVCCIGFDTVLDGFQQITQRLTNTGLLGLFSLAIAWQCDGCHTWEHQLHGWN